MTAAVKYRDEPTYKTASEQLGDDVVLTPYAPGRGLPLFIQPNTPKLSDDTDYAIAWLEDKQPAIEDLLCSAGAIVLRGFPIDRSIDFAHAVKGYGTFERGYVGGVADRVKIVENVMTANSLRSDLTIDIHQEMSYLPRWPTRIAFYCRMAPASGGATLICDMREATRGIDPKLFQEVAKRGIRHVRNYRAPGSDSHPVIGQYHKIWTEAFETDDPKQAEATCRAMGFDTMWHEDGSLEASYKVPGVITHPRTGDQIWFNQMAVYTNTPKTSPELYRLHEEAYPKGKRRPFVSTYGDGGEIPMELIEPVKPMVNSLAVSFPWCHGDVLLIDNYLVGHGRETFTGHRDIQVALLA